MQSWTILFRVQVANLCCSIWMRVCAGLWMGGAIPGACTAAPRGPTERARTECNAGQFAIFFEVSRGAETVARKWQHWTLPAERIMDVDVPGLGWNFHKMVYVAQDYGRKGPGADSCYGAVGERYEKRDIQYGAGRRRISPPTRIQAITRHTPSQTAAVVNSQLTHNAKLR